MSLLSPRCLAGTPPAQSSLNFALSSKPEAKTWVLRHPAPHFPLFRVPLLSNTSSTVVVNVFIMLPLTLGSFTVPDT
jgi:hypothetical protein